MKKILLIAGNGFIGGHIVEHLVDKYEVYILSRSNKFKCEYFEKYNHKVNFIKLNSLLELPNIDLNHFDTIINLLTTIKPTNEENTFIEVVKDELHFNNLLLKNMDKTVKYIYCSSAGTIYSSDNSNKTEESKILPSNEYGLLKSINEQLINYYHDESIILRISNPVGYGQKNNEKKGIVTQMAINILENKKMILFDPKNITKDYFDIDDLCKLIIEMIENFKVGTYNVCSGSSKTIFELKLILEELTSIKLDYEVRNAKSYDNQIVNTSNQKLLNNYNFEFNGIDNTCKKLLSQLKERK